MSLSKNTIPHSHAFYYCSRITRNINTNTEDKGIVAYANDMLMIAKQRRMLENILSKTDRMRKYRKD